MNVNAAMQTPISKVKTDKT